MSNPSKEKGTRAESLIKEELKKYTGLPWERTPLSGALHEKHGLKSDLYVPNEHNLFTVECKHYKDDHFTSQLLTNKLPQLIAWWEQTKHAGTLVNKKPLLIFKHDRSKIFAAYEDMPNTDYRLVFYSGLGYNFYISTLTDWLLNEKPKFIK